jgi:hypothetical protein
MSPIHGATPSPFPPVPLARHSQKKGPHGFRRAGCSARPTLSLLAVALLHGYVMSPVLVPDLHQRLGTATLSGSRLAKILG